MSALPSSGCLLCGGGGWVFREKRVITDRTRVEMGRTLSEEESEFEASLMALAFAVRLAEGWGTREISGTERCPCITSQWKARGPAGPKPALTEVVSVVDALSELIPFFPKDELAKKIIAAKIAHFVESKEALRWFGEAAATCVTKWEGIAMLRALYATRYRLTDGPPPTIVNKDGECKTLYFPGSSPEELESQAKNLEMEENNRRLEVYRRQALALPPSERTPFPLPAVKSLQ